MAIGLAVAIAGAGIAFGRSIRSFLVPPPIRHSEPPQGFPFDLTGMLVEREHIRLGGPPKDGIPAIDEPRIVPISAAVEEELEDDDWVVTVTVDGRRRAYPIRLLLWHEIVNDTLAGVPISVIYCPLCDSVSVVERTVAGPEADRVDTFGVSGQILDSNVLVYDRSADGLWSQIEGRAITGRHAGRQLVHRAGWAIETLADAIASADEAAADLTLVGFPKPARRPYDKNPYGDYADVPDLMFPVRRLDDRLPRKAPVIGLVADGAAHAWDLRAIHAGRADDDRFRVPFEAGELVLEVAFNEAHDPASGVRRVVVHAAPPGSMVIHTYWFAWASAHPTTSLMSVDTG